MLLPTVAGDATDGARRCYQRCMAMLPTIASNAPDGARRCYQWGMPMRPTVAGDSPGGVFSLATGGAHEAAIDGDRV